MTAKEMAGKKYPNRYFSVWVYHINDNPHRRKHPLHVKWHNEFYDECRKIGRSI